MSYIEQFDGLVRLQDYDSRMRNVRTMAVFTDGIVICSVGVSGVWLINEALLPGFGVLGRLLLTVIRPGQQVVHRRRQAAHRADNSSQRPQGTGLPVPDRPACGPDPRRARTARRRPADGVGSQLTVLLGGVPAISGNECGRVRRGMRLGPVR